MVGLIALESKWAPRLSDVHYTPLFLDARAKQSAFLTEHQLKVTNFIEKLSKQINVKGLELETQPTQAAIVPSENQNSCMSL